MYRERIERGWSQYKASAKWQWSRLSDEQLADLRLAVSAGRAAEGARPRVAAGAAINKEKETPMDQEQWMWMQSSVALIATAAAAMALAGSRDLPREQLPVAADPIAGP